MFEAWLQFQNNEEEEEKKSYYSIPFHSKENNLSGVLMANTPHHECSRIKTLIFYPLLQNKRMVCDANAKLSLCSKTPSNHECDWNRWTVIYALNHLPV